jgi:predicted MFS family arabinose efflux permease
VAGALLAAGFADFALIGFHFQKANVMPRNLIPVFYAVAMAASALASIPLGRLFDRLGPNVSLFAFLISAVAAPFIFLGASAFALVGMIFLGSRDERSGIAVSSDAYRRYSTAETKHGFWLV